MNVRNHNRGRGPRGLLLRRVSQPTTLGMEYVPWRPWTPMVSGGVTGGAVEPEAVIRRIASRDDGMFGVLLLRRPMAGLLPFCLTLEDPWRNNQEGESCIPAGSYENRRINSPHFGNTFTLLNVPGRSLIRWHWGNTHLDTKGCIILAESFDGAWDNSTSVLNSKAAFRRFLEAMADVDSFSLTIEDRWGGSTTVPSNLIQ